VSRRLCTTLVVAACLVALGAASLCILNERRMSAVETQQRTLLYQRDRQVLLSGCMELLTTWHPRISMGRPSQCPGGSSRGNLIPPMPATSPSRMSGQTACAARSTAACAMMTRLVRQSIKPDTHFTKEQSNALDAAILTYL
jgi:hypothetical protein